MNEQEAQAILHRVTYKPRFDLELLGYGDGIGGLRMMTEVFNADNPSQRIPIFRHASIPFGHLRCEADFLGLIGHRLREFENHEVDEWFRIDGKCFMEPHPERAAR